MTKLTPEQIVAVYMRAENRPRHPESNAGINGVSASSSFHDVALVAVEPETLIAVDEELRALGLAEKSIQILHNAWNESVLRAYGALISPTLSGLRSGKIPTTSIKIDPACPMGFEALYDGQDMTAKEFLLPGIPEKGRFLSLLQEIATGTVKNRVAEEPLLLKTAKTPVAEPAAAR